MWNLSGAAGSESSCWLYVFVAWANAGTWDTGTIGLSLEMWQLRFYTDDKASTNFKQLPSELPWIAFVLCLLQYQHDQKTFAKFCQKHNQENAFTILVPPQLDYIAGPSNKMCPRPGITLGLIIQNCHKAIATQKRMIYLPNFLSRALLSLQVAAVTEDCRPADELQHLGLWSDTVIHHSRHQASCSPGALATLTPYNATPWLLSLFWSLYRQYSRDPPQHNSNPIKITTLTCGAIKVASLLSVRLFWEARQLQRNEEKPETMCLDSSNSRQ